jgi:transcriptional regulator with XRE-family HTH domain
MCNEITQNSLWTYRKKKGLSQKRVAFLLAHKTPSQLSHYEQGAKLPNLANGLKLEIIYRVPVAYLYHQLYNKLREEIFTRETALKKMLGKE